MTNTEHRTVRLQVLVTPTEAAYIRRVAEENGVTVSDFIRQVLTDFSD